VSTETGEVQPADYVALRLEPTETGGKLPMLGVEVAQPGAKTIDGVAIRIAPALPGRVPEPL
jgi:hypothetical protein